MEVVKLILKWIFVFLYLSSCVTTNEILRSFNLNTVLEGLMDANSTCGIHLREYMKNLSLDELWAVKMYDSSSNVLHGIYEGNTKIVNHFDQCLSVQHPQKVFATQNCIIRMDILVGLEAGRQGYAPFSFNLTSEYASILYGLCLPDSCSAEEIEENLKKWFSKSTIAGLNETINIKVDADDCYTNEKIQSKKFDKTALTILGTIAIIAFISTACDLVQRHLLQNGQLNHLLISFSLYTNTGYLFQTNNDSEIKALNGIRVLVLSWIIFGHVGLFLHFGPVENLKQGIDMVFDESYAFLWNALITVDIFLFLSGFLVSRSFFRKISKTGYFDFPLSYIHRFLRVTPSLALVIFIQTVIYIDLGSGPLWYFINKFDPILCFYTWPMSILHVGNYVCPRMMCLGHTWSLAVDMQLYLLSPIVLIPLLYRPKLAPYYLAGLVSFSTLISFIVNYRNKFSPYFVDLISRYTSEYVTTHTRATPWLMGLALGYVLYRMQEKHTIIKLSKVLIGWLVSGGIVLWTLLGINLIENIETRPIISASYIALQKVTVSLAMSWVVFVCVTGYGGIVNSFLSSNIFQNFGKLSYSIYLIHIPVIKFLVGSRKTSYYVDLQEWSGTFFNTIFLCLTIAIPLTLLVEIPALIIDTCIFQNAKILPIYDPARKKEKTIKIK